MTDIARLVLGVDARGMREGERAIADVGKEADNTARKVDRASTEMAADLNAVGAAAAGTSRNMRQFGQAANAAAVSAGQMRASTMQLGQQIGDVSQGLALGVSPMTIFAQQGGQVAFAMSGLGGVLGTVGRFLSGPWGAAVMGAALILPRLVSALNDTEKAAGDASKVTLSFLDELGIALRPIATQARLAFRTLGDEFALAATKIKAALPDISGAIRGTLSLMDRLNNRVASFTGGDFQTSNMTGQFDIDRARELALRRGLATESRLNAGPLGSSFVDAVTERSGRMYQDLLSDVALGTGAVADATRAYKEAEERLERQVNAGLVTYDQARVELTRRRGAIDAARDATQKAATADREAEQAARSYAAAQRQLAAETVAYFNAVKVPQLGSMTQGEGRDALGKLVDRLGEARDQTRRDTVTIADSFAQMSQRVTNSLQSLASSIRGGDFLGILGGVIDLFTQFGSAGLFGKSIQTGLNTSVAPSNRSMGGPVYSGSPYLVGERGPELFTPPGTGRIVANDNMAAPVRVMVGVDPRNGNITAYVNGQIAQTAPLVANAGAQQAQSQAAASARRRVR